MMARSTDPELPWGNWLRMEMGKDAKPVFVDDETGRSWPSLRSALWTGRLRMNLYNREPSSELLETMHAVLAATVRRSPTFREQATDLFQGNQLYLRLFHLWLESNDLVGLDTDGHGANGLTSEGWSVLHMLMATRPYDVRQERPSGATISALCELGLGPEDREERLARVEKEASRWEASFLRRHEAGKPSIVLSKRGDGLVPVFQIVWTLRMETVEQRDRFYEWLCLRLDRWEAWGQKASEYGAADLTMHLLQVAAAALVDASND
jgi:hypothetical protein